ncbi:hypothetical protein L9F63_024062, partial [Diploptera punctata]
MAQALSVSHLLLKPLSELEYYFDVGNTEFSLQSSFTDRCFKEKVMRQVYVAVFTFRTIVLMTKERTTVKDNFVKEFGAEIFSTRTHCKTEVVSQ